jgi:hypothetical protein
LCDKAQYSWQEDDVLLRTYYGEPRCGWYQTDEGREPVYTLYQDCRKRITTCSCVVTCNATAPTNIYFNPNTVLLTWTPGVNGVSQRLYVSKTQSDVTNNCGDGTNCTLSQTLTPSASSYPLTGILESSTVYYVKLVTYKDASCSPFTNYSFFSPGGAWWQVKDGDAVTNGDLESDVPLNMLFMASGSGGYRGVPVTRRSIFKRQII